MWVIVYYIYFTIFQALMPKTSMSWKYFWIYLKLQINSNGFSRGRSFGHQSICLFVVPNLIVYNLGMHWLTIVPFLKYSIFRLILDPRCKLVSTYYRQSIMQKFLLILSRGSTSISPELVIFLVNECEKHLLGKQVQTSSSFSSSPKIVFVDWCGTT